MQLLDGSVSALVGAYDQLTDFEIKTTFSLSLSLRSSSVLHVRSFPPPFFSMKYQGLVLWIPPKL